MLYLGGILLHVTPCILWLRSERLFIRHVACMQPRWAKVVMHDDVLSCVVCVGRVFLPDAECV